MLYATFQGHQSFCSGGDFGKLFSLSYTDVVAMLVMRPWLNKICLNHVRFGSDCPEALLEKKLKSVEIWEALTDVLTWGTQKSLCTHLVDYIHKNIIQKSLTISKKWI